MALDLATNVATARREDTGGDAAAWFERTRGKSLSYTDLLDELTTTAAERMRLLQSYFEPTHEDRTAGVKRPTRGHRVIADLVRDGDVRVIITTNFDRLIETALREIGIEPTVLSTGDAVAGAPPPGQTRCLVIKVHGDYLDVRLRNTAAEVAILDPETEQLVRRVLAEYGLLVLGWSAKWDTGLNAIVESAITGRFATHWATRRDLPGVAASTAAARAATVVQIRDADSFRPRPDPKTGAVEHQDRHDSGASGSAVPHKRSSRRPSDEPHLFLDHEHRLGEPAPASARPPDAESERFGWPDEPRLDLMDAGEHCLGHRAFAHEQGREHLDELGQATCPGDECRPVERLRQREVGRRGRRRRAEDPPEPDPCDVVGRPLPRWPSRACRQ